MPADLPLEHVSIEPDSPIDGPAPAVFVLHGRGADEEDLLPVARKLPDELHVVSLRAPDQLMGVSDERSESETRGAPQGYHGGYTWYELDVPDGDLHESQPDAEEFRRSLDLVAESIRAATDAHDLDPDRIGLLGFSQGAITALSLLLEAPEEYAWVVALHGYLAESHADRDPDVIADSPVFIGAGSADEIIPAERAETAAERLREIGCAVEEHTYGTGHGIGREELADVIAFVESQVG